MEAKVSHCLQLSRWTCSEKTVMMPSHSLGFSPRVREKQRLWVPISSHFHPKKAATWHRPVELNVSCTQTFPASVLESKSFPATCEEDSRLKNKSEEIEAELDGRCIYLIGMMGSGKTTVGRVLSEVLRYSFFDSDKLIEQAVGGTAVADIFKLYGESFFRNNETEVLRKLSSMHRLVVSTGGGVVIRPINWEYMEKGISVWLDVPLEALARRIAKEGTHSRPLVHQELGDAYASTLARLSTLWEERSEAYINNANARVSLENIAAKMGYGDVCSITPNEIAFEILEMQTVSYPNWTNAEFLFCTLEIGLVFNYSTRIQGDGMAWEAIVSSPELAKENKHQIVETVHLMKSLPWEAIVSLPEMAIDNKHQIVETVHLMKSLPEQKNGLARRIFSKAVANAAFWKPLMSSFIVNRR